MKSEKESKITREREFIKTEARRTRKINDGERKTRKAKWNLTEEEQKG